MTRLLRCASLAFGLVAALLVGCKSRGDDDADRRLAWIAEKTRADESWGHDFLRRAGDSKYHDAIFYDGWSAAELNPNTKFAWRSAGRRGIIRLRTKTNGDSVARDMDLELTGFVPHEHMSVSRLQLEFAVNGHVVNRFDPPAETFTHHIFVPHWLLDHSEWVDFSITAANVVSLPGDWRELGFATTGFRWLPAPAN